MPSACLPSLEAPKVDLTALDQLWFQVGGTVCNLRCHHCFISCAPDNHSYWFMSREHVARALDESVLLGVKEYYFTGGEPFMNQDIHGILEDTLRVGPATVLTNATLMPDARVRDLRQMSAASTYTLEIRVSLDGVSASMNDAIRGEGAFDRAMGGVARLVDAGFLPIITTMQSWPEAQSDRILAEFKRILAEVGYGRPRLKVLPPLLIGEEATRSRVYTATERVTHEMLHGFDLDQLLCTRARLVTDRGVHACPILLDYPSARLADTLTESTRVPARLEESACFTCYTSGAICANMPAGAKDLS